MEACRESSADSLAVKVPEFDSVYLDVLVNTFFLFFALLKVNFSRENPKNSFRTEYPTALFRHLIAGIGRNVVIIRSISVDIPPVTRYND